MYSKGFVAVQIVGAHCIIIDRLFCSQAALKLATAALQKHKDNQLLRVLKALALTRLDKIQEAYEVLYNSGLVTVLWHDKSSLKICLCCRPRWPRLAALRPEGLGVRCAFFTDRACSPVLVFRLPSAFHFILISS